MDQLQDFPTTINTTTTAACHCPCPCPAPYTCPPSSTPPFSFSDFTNPLSPARHNLAFLAACVAACVASLPLLSVTLYWLLLPLRLSRASPPWWTPRAVQPAGSGRPAIEAIASPFWVTRYFLLSYPNSHDGRRARVVGIFVYGIVWGLCRTEEEFGERLAGWVWSVVWWYAALAVGCTAIRWARWIGWVVLVLLGRGLVDVVVKAGKEGLRQWRRNWKIPFGIAVIWFVVAVKESAPWLEVWEKSVGDVLVMAAEVVYRLGDIPRDLAGGPHWQVRREWLWWW